MVVPSTTMTAGEGHSRGPLLEHLISRRLDVLFLVLRLPEASQVGIHSAAGAALVAERAVLGDAVPRIDRDVAREAELLRVVELLPWNADGGDRDARRLPRRPVDACILDRHAMR